jgi:cell division protein ZapA (FtsZ GTPase activity inhibitor)
MSELSIKVSIAGRTYPLTIKREEEELIRKAAKEVDDNVRTLQQTYAVKDKQDLLAMAALQMATNALKFSKKEDDTALTSRLDQLDSALNDYLS